MTERKALKLALEAFEAIPEEIEGWIPDKSTDAVIAIKEALAQPEPCDMGELCIGCSPRNADGSCPDAQHSPEHPSCM